MGTIRILSDKGDVYGAGTKVKTMDFIQDYIDSLNETENGSLIDFICRIPFPSAVAYVAGAWGIEYEFVE